MVLHMIEHVGVLVSWSPSMDPGATDPVFMDLQAFFSPQTPLTRPEWQASPAGVASGSIPAHTLDGFRRHAERVAIHHHRETGLRSLQLLHLSESSWESYYAFGEAAR